MIKQTEKEYKAVIKSCREVFERKTRDYGTAWRVLRLPSITDQIFIKAKRIRSIQEKQSQRVEDNVASEFIGIINYCIIALIQLSLTEEDEMDMQPEQVMRCFDEQVEEIWGLLGNKNHDYGEAWRDMRVSSITDIILMKLYRIKQIEDNEGQTEASEGVDANYRDIVNYAVFALIQSNFLHHEENH